MKKSRTLSSKVALLGASVALASAGWVATAHAANGQGYATDVSGKLIRNTDGACMRTGAWTPAMADPSCEPGNAGSEATSFSNCSGCASDMHDIVNAALAS